MKKEKRKEKLLVPSNVPAAAKYISWKEMRAYVRMFQKPTNAVRQRKCRLQPDGTMQGSRVDTHLHASEKCKGQTWSSSCQHHSGLSSPASNTKIESKRRRRQLRLNVNLQLRGSSSSLMVGNTSLDASTLHLGLTHISVLPHISRLRAACCGSRR